MGSNYATSRKGAMIIRQSVEACNRSGVWDCSSNLLSTEMGKTCLGVTETIGLDIQTRSVQDNLGDFLRVSFLVHSLRGEDLVATLSNIMDTQ